MHCLKDYSLRKRKLIANRWKVWLCHKCWRVRKGWGNCLGFKRQSQNKPILISHKEKTFTLSTLSCLPLNLSIKRQCPHTAYSCTRSLIMLNQCKPAGIALIMPNGLLTNTIILSLLCGSWTRWLVHDTLVLILDVDPMVKLVVRRWNLDLRASTACVQAKGKPDCKSRNGIVIVHESI